MLSFILAMIVCMMVSVSLASCNISESDTKEIYNADIEVTEEALIVNGIKLGQVKNCGEIYFFTAINETAYLYFLDAMEEKIEILDISIAYGETRHYYITYKQPQ